MVKAVYDGAYGFTVSGHAGQAPIGQDLVCAATSTLIMALVEDMAQNDDKLIARKSSVQSGCVYLKVIPSADYKEACEGAFSVVRNGFKLLSQQYSKYISYEECI